MNKLTNRQRVFVEEYLQCWVGTEAATRAGYSKRTANEQAARLLANVSIKREIEQRIVQLKATTDEELLRLAAHARGSIGDFLDSNGLIDIDKARAANRLALVKKIRQHTTRISKTTGEDVEYHDIELELYDAQAATVQLLKIMGQFIDRVEVSDLRDKPDDALIREFQTILEAARARAADSDK